MAPSTLQLCRLAFPRAENGLPRRRVSRAPAPATCNGCAKGSPEPLLDRGRGGPVGWLRARDGQRGPCRPGSVWGGSIVFSCRRGIGSFAAALILTLWVASPAAASPETLKRSVSNLLMAPLDILFGPYVGMRSVFVNVREIDDTTGVRVAYFLPGLGWNVGQQTFAGAFRLLSGALEFIPGLFLLPFEADIRPIYALAERQDGIVDIEFPFLYLKFGINYVDP